ncbi:hypothetical protein [Bacteroides zoogleoformans]|uniref:hypothetical protein n=1 Tax=Bacteroides zoogleoformans TaxID=28119 RepID=UPI00248EEB67|nr:hypothetical protein [Bacteroides zoogleoformans]
MEDVFKFLLVAAVIAIGIVKQIKKEAQKNADKKPVMPVPDADFPLSEHRDEDTYGDSVPAGSGMEAEVIRQSSVRPAKQLRNKKQPSRPQTTASQHSSVNAFSPPTYSPPESDETSGFDIHSVEEARKAVIWSEIIQRKY